MPVTNNVHVQYYAGVLNVASWTSGTAQSLSLVNLGGFTATTVTENNNSLQVGETVTMGNGNQAVVLGSGTAAALLSTKPVVLMQDLTTGGYFFLYPQGPYGLLGVLLVSFTLTVSDYTFPGGIVCFATGSAIRTAAGDVAVQDIRPGMRVWTLDDGLCEVVWAGGRPLGRAPTLREWPIRIPAGALGAGMPAQALTVSPQHRLLLRSQIAARVTGEAEVLIAARFLIGVNGIHSFRPRQDLAYHHILLDRHALVSANGAPAESLLLGPMALRALGPRAGAEIASLLPGPPRAAARRLVTGRDGRDLLRRHVKHGRPLVA